jgi:Glycosyltransferase family 87
MTARRVRARVLMTLGWRVALITAIVCTSLLYAIQLTHQPSGPFDFKGGLYNAGTAILHGHNPYRAGFLAHQAAIMHAGGIAQGETVRHAFSIPLYPAAANLAIVPFSLLPYWLAATLFTGLSITAMIAAVRLLGVRDWRCFALALISWPSLSALDLGAIGPLLLLGVAVAWRWREKLWPPAIAIASIVVAKLFPWPLAVWLLVTRRFRALALTVLIGVIAMFGAWAVIGFAGMAEYPQMLSNASFIQEGRASSLVAVLLATGLSPGLAQMLALGAGIGLLGIAWRFARRPDGDRQAFCLALVAALTASPIVWDHYMVLLFVPIALVSPRLSPLWFLPTCTPLIGVILAGLFPTGHAAGAFNPATVRGAGVWLLVEAVIVVRVCWPDLLGWPVRSVADAAAVGAQSPSPPVPA